MAGGLFIRAGEAKIGQRLQVAGRFFVIDEILKGRVMTTIRAKEIDGGQPRIDRYQIRRAHHTSIWVLP